MLRLEDIEGTKPYSSILLPILRNCLDMLYRIYFRSDGCGTQRGGSSWCAHVLAFHSSQPLRSVLQGRKTPHVNVFLLLRTQHIIKCLCASFFPVFTQYHAIASSSVAPDTATRSTYTLLTSILNVLSLGMLIQQDDN